MIVKVNFNISLQCSRCGVRLSFAENTNTDKYDSILEVEPHVCGKLTMRAADVLVCPTCQLELDNDGICPKCFGQYPTRR